MTNAILKMQSRLASLMADRDRIDAEISEIQSALNVVRRYSDDEQTLESGASEALYRMAFGTTNQTKHQRIIERAKEILSDGCPRPTAALVEAIRANGIEISDTNEKSIANLSAYLSREKDIFISNRKLGWSLKELTPASVAAQAGVGVPPTDDEL